MLPLSTSTVLPFPAAGLLVPSPPMEPQPPLPPLPYLRLRFALRALETARLPPFAGSLLRGAFGHAFRKSVCTVGPAQECAACRLRHECAYARVFETPLGPGEAPPSLRGQTTAPHPYVFETSPVAGELAAGDELRFDLLLFGDAIGHQARIVWAVERMATVGLGVRRARFALARVEAVGPSGRTPLFAEGGGSTRAPARGLPLPAEPLPGDGRRVRLRFLTPLRLRKEGRLVPPRDPRDLIYQMARRLYEVAHVHTPDFVEWPFRPLLDAASRLEAPEWDFRLVRLDRFSARQGGKLELDGHVGTAVLEGDLTPLAPLLRAAEVLHVGKATVFGLGRFVLEPAPRP